MFVFTNGRKFNQNGAEIRRAQNLKKKPMHPISVRKIECELYIAMHFVIRNESAINQPKLVSVPFKVSLTNGKNTTRTLYL